MQNFAWKTSMKIYGDLYIDIGSLQAGDFDKKIK